jgi:hypothetical protein
MYKHILPFLLLIATYSAVAQSEIRSTLKDEKNNPIPFATIYLPQSKNTSISSENGDFYIIASPEDKAIIVSHLSYQGAKIKITAHFPETIILKNAATELKEVVVSNELSAMDIAFKVVQNLDKNHENTPTYYEYFRRIADYTPDRKTVNLIQEFQGIVVHTKSNNTKSNIKKSRAIPFTKAGEKQLTKLLMHDYMLMRHDNIFLYKPEFLKKGPLKKYEVVYEGTTMINGIDCYILRYTNTGEAHESKKATLYIDPASYGIVKAITCDYAISHGKYTIERNFINVDGKWVLSSVIERNRVSQPKVAITLYTYQKDKAKYASEKLSGTDNGLSHRLSQYNKNPNDNFWDNYQHIPLPEN